MSQDIRTKVREHYAGVVVERGSCCGGDGKTSAVHAASRSVGYSESELASIPEEANLGAGCGNPLAFAEIQAGDTVLDLGSGAGIDCFLAAERVGEKGHVIGVDMTPEMIAKARDNAAKAKRTNVEFRLGEIEQLPVDSDSVDVIISNCVINLSPEKQRVFGEAFRVLKPGGKLLVSDIVLMKDLPERIRNSISAYVGCIAGADKLEDYLNAIERAGFGGIEVVGRANVGPVAVGCGCGDGDLGDAAASVQVRAVKS